MTPQQPSDNLKPNATPVDQRSRWSGAVLGYAIGWVGGSLIGWLIDSALTSAPYAGVRIGGFVGGLCGAMLGGGTGWTGVGMMLSMVICSAGGAGVGLALWNLGPNSFEAFIPAGIGGIVGACIGLAFAAIVFRARQQPAPDTEPTAEASSVVRTR